MLVCNSLSIWLVSNLIILVAIGTSFAWLLRRRSQISRRRICVHYDWLSEKAGGCDVGPFHRMEQYLKTIGASVIADLTDLTDPTNLADLAEKIESCPECFQNHSAAA